MREINPAGEDFEGAPFSRMMPLFLAIDPPDDLTLMQEEIFGPILVLKGYGELDEAIAYVNARPRPLALYYFGDDRDEERRVLAHTTSGGVTLNDVGWHVLQEDLPFGGIGASGMGAYHGRAGFLEFSHAKSVFRQARLDLAGLIGFRPPYGRRLRSILRREIRK